MYALGSIPPLEQRLIPLTIGASVLLMGWSIIEPGMYLIAACLLALRPILRKMSPKELKTRLRIPSFSRAPDNAKSDDSQGLRHTAEPPGKSSSEGIELQSTQDKRSAHEETTLPPRSIDVDLSLRHYDVEQGFTSLARYVPSAGK